MINLVKRKINNLSDCCKYIYEFRNSEDNFITFMQGGNRDLYFTLNSKEYKKEIDLEITKEDELLYNLVEELYNSLTTGIMPGFNTIDTYFLNKLYDGNKISWKSDAPLNELDWNTEFKYNFLNIYKKDENFIFNFINNSDLNRFTIEFNTDRSRYGRYVFPFYDFLNKLENIAIPYEEKQKIKKRG